MQKTYLILAAAVLLLSCAKDPSVPAAGADCLTICASLPPATKLSWDGSDETGYKAAFDVHDRIVVYWRNASGSQVGSLVALPVDAASISADGRSAAFSADGISVPSGATQLFAYLDSDANPDYMTWSNAPFVEMASQGGSFAEAMGRQIAAASLPLTDLSAGVEGLAADLVFSWRTAMVKIELTFPEGSVPPASTPLTVKNEGNTFYNRVRLTWGEPFSIASRNTRGPITTLPASVEGHTLSAWICIWAGDDFSDGIISLQSGETTWTTTFSPAGSILPGKIYRIRRTLSGWDPTAGEGGITAGGYNEI